MHMVCKGSELKIVIFNLHYFENCTQSLSAAVCHLKTFFFALTDMECDSNTRISTVLYMYKWYGNKKGYKCYKCVSILLTVLEYFSLSVQQRILFCLKSVNIEGAKRHILRGLNIRLHIVFGYMNKIHTFIQ